jgi:tRNA pseudouridine55 synthase
VTVDGGAHASPSARGVGGAPPERPAGNDGLLLIDKPAGITSHDAVAAVRRALRTKKVGHSGTLDPMATGLLLMGVGRATRLLRFLGELAKEYEGTALLGIETDTLDADGRVVRTADAGAVTSEALREAMGALTGEVEQIPPAYSAVKVGGEPLHRAARRGESVTAPPRRVHVERFDLTGSDLPVFAFEVTCSSGTYVRTLVADAGGALGCGAHLTSLRRTRIGPFAATDGRPPEDPGPPRPIESAVAHLPSLVLEPEEARVARHGSILGPAGLSGPYRVHAPDGALIGVYRDAGTKAVPEVILA